jgi:hypothetical protein
MPLRLLLLLSLLVGSQVTTAFSYGEISDSTQVLVKKTADFKVNGKGNSPSWGNTAWIPITVQESSGKPLSTKVKVLYSNSGIYFLFMCEDQKLTATIAEDFRALYKEDVVEVFLWPDQSVPIYFEYELSPLNYELPILVPNLNGRFQGWKPWGYEGSRKIQHATSAQEGPKQSQAKIKSWMAEFFIPFELLNPIVQAPPKPGTQWRANFYRIDYDSGYTTWTWQKTTPHARGNFHEFKKFGTLFFE